MRFETIYKYSCIRLPFDSGGAQILDILEGETLAYVLYTTESISKTEYL